MNWNLYLLINEVKNLMENLERWEIYERVWPCKIKKIRKMFYTYNHIQCVSKYAALSFFKVLSLNGKPQLLKLKFWAFSWIMIKNVGLKINYLFDIKNIVYLIAFYATCYEMLYFVHLVKICGTRRAKFRNINDIFNLTTPHDLKIL